MLQFKDVQCNIEVGSIFCSFLLKYFTSTIKNFRFLRSSNDFLCRHISALPFKNSQNACVLNQMTGLLKTVAIELKLTATNNQVTQFANMCKIWLGVVHESNVTQGLIDSRLGDMMNGNTGSQYISMLRQNQTFDNATNKSEQQHSGLLICKLLECLDFEMKKCDQPKLDFFDNALIQQLLTVCLSYFLFCFFLHF